jgi:hypothetical protein
MIQLRVVIKSKQNIKTKSLEIIPKINRIVTEIVKYYMADRDTKSPNTTKSFT